MTSDLRIYYGSARITLTPDDPRVAKILALVVGDVAPAPASAEVKLPRNDAEFIALAARYFRERD